jgi:hypothetical protein
LILRPQIRIAENIRHVDGAALQERSSANGVAARRNRIPPGEILKFTREAALRRYFQYAAVRTPNGRRVARTKAHRGLDQSIEHGLQIKARTAQHLEHFSRGGLLLKRFVALARTLIELFLQIERAGRRGPCSSGFTLVWMGLLFSRSTIALAPLHLPPPAIKPQLKANRSYHSQTLLSCDI